MTVELVRAAIEEAELNSPRAKQVESGASQTFGCRAESLLRLTDVPQSNPRVGLAAVVGKAIHAYLETVLVGVLTERRFTYRDVPCTVDAIFQAQKALRDFKSTTNDKLTAIVKDGPKPSHRGQIHLGAAAAIEAGIEIETVGLIYIPRDSNNLDDMWEWSEPFSQELADKAADWHAEQRERAANHDPRKPLLDGLRDEPLYFCEQFCGYVDICRGPDRAVETDDPELVEVAEKFLTAKLEADEAYARKRHYQEQLQGVPPLLVNGYKLAWSGGNRKSETVVDVEELKAAFEMFVGPLPMTTIETTTARSFRVTKPRAS